MSIPLAISSAGGLIMNACMLRARRLAGMSVLGLFYLALIGGAAPMSAAETTGSAGFESLPAKTVGVLVGDIQAVLARSGRRGLEDAVGFASGKGGYRWVYVASEKGSADSQSLRLPVGKEGSERKLFESVEQLRRPMLKEMGLNPDFQLVEAEVNERAGSPGGNIVVLTGIKALDGTKEYPLSVSVTVSELKKEFAVLLREKEKEIDAAMTREQKKALGDKTPNGKLQKTQEVEVTWLPKDEVLQVVFSQRITDGLYSYGKGIEKSRGMPRRPAGGLGPQTTAQRFGITFGVEARATYQVTKTGESRTSTPKFVISAIRSVTPPPSGNKLLPTRKE
jgi:hypothetical protein